MKKILLTVMAAAACLAVQAQRLSIASLSVDCGRTGFQVPVSATFELRNKGLRRLVVSDVKADCGCTKVEMTKRELGPGERATLTVTYDARMLGHFEKQVALTTNATKKPVYLKMKGVVLADLKDYSGTYPFDMGGLLADKDNLEFDNVNKGDHPQVEINILNNTDEIMTPNVLHLPPYLSALATPERLAPARAGKVTLTLNSENIHDYGLTQTSVYLARQLGDKIQSGNEISISTVLLPDLTKYEGEGKDMAPAIQLSSQQIDLGEFGKKTKKSGDIVITNSGASTLKISSLQMFTPGLRVTLSKRELLPGEKARLRVTGYRDELRKVRTRPRVLMITNAPDLPKVVIDIRVQ